MTHKISTPVKLASTDLLKLTFQVIEKDGGKGVQPHQTFLRFYDEKSGEEGIQPVRVTSGGKAKFELVSGQLIPFQYIIKPYLEHGQATTLPTSHV